MSAPGQFGAGNGQWEAVIPQQVAQGIPIGGGQQHGIQQINGGVPMSSSSTSASVPQEQWAQVEKHYSHSKAFPPNEHTISLAPLPSSGGNPLQPMSVPPPTFQPVPLGGDLKKVSPGNGALSGNGGVHPSSSSSSSGSRGLIGGLGVALVLFIFATIGLAIALGVINERYSHKDEDIQFAVDEAVAMTNRARTCSAANPDFLNFPARVADVFDPLTAEQLAAVTAFISGKLGLADSEPESISGADWLFMMDNYQPDKSVALDYIDNGNPSSYPGRYARAVVYHLANPATAKVVEYKIGPIASFDPVPDNTPFSPISYGGSIGTDIPYRMRPVSSMEYAAMEPLVNSTCKTIADLMRQSYGETYDDGRIWWTDSSPRAYTRAQRRSWIWFTWNALGMYQLPLGLEMLIDHTSLDSSQWTVLQIVYNDQAFSSAAALQAAFTSNSLTKLDYPFPATSDWVNSPLWSSMIRRGNQRALGNASVPLTAPQGGRRFGVKNRQVQWLGWDLHLGHSAVSGTFFNDIRFRNERIVYELALQDAFAGYSGFNPIQATSTYSDGGWGLGYSDFPLMPGVDCPPWAMYLDTYSYVEGAAKTNKRSVCVWEQPDNIAIMRHYDQDFINGGYSFAAGYPRTSLIVRTSSTVYNYDYIISTIFHADGTLEVSAAATGYPQATIYPSHPAAQTAEQSFSTRLSERSMGSLHDHLFCWKVDMDILGSPNTLVRSEVRAGRFDLPYVFPGANTPLKYVAKQVVANEDNGLLIGSGTSSIRYNPNHPATFSFINTAATNGRNAFGVQRSYNIYIPGTIAQLNNETAPWMPAVEWTLNNVVVTQRKESERHASMPLYDIQAPGEPIYRFSSLSNGESLNQQDLVAWIATGTLHMPAAEDAPVTNTPATTTGFFLRPANYFDISPSTDLSDYFYKTGPIPQGDSPAHEASQFLPPAGKRCSDPVNPPEY